MTSQETQGAAEFFGALTGLSWTAHHTAAKSFLSCEDSPVAVEIAGRPEGARVNGLLAGEEDYVSDDGERAWWSWFSTVGLSKVTRMSIFWSGYGPLEEQLAELAQKLGARHA